MLKSHHAISGEKETMRRIAMRLVVAIAIPFAAACTPDAPGIGSPEVVATVAAPAGPSQAPAPSGSGTQVVVTLADNTIESSLTDFKAGIPYTFVITNTGPHAHDFNISQPVSVVGSLDAALKSALLVVPQQQLGPGDTATVAFTFPDTATSLKWEFSCLIRRHYEDGMFLAITIVK
jgi:uncharacterized cupredoxin-like copper-binding protein